MMEQNMAMRSTRSNRSATWRLSAILLTMLVALVLMTSAAFAQSGDDSLAYSAPEEVIGVASAPWVIRADANPSMDVALWYAPVRVNGALLASQALHAGANPSMDLALWYAPVQVNGTLLANGALHADANPSMNVALWYTPPESDFEALLCMADTVGGICQ
jgi:hypothetical protein